MLLEINTLLNVQVASNYKLFSVCKCSVTGWYYCSDDFESQRLQCTYDSMDIGVDGWLDTTAY